MKQEKPQLKQYRRARYVADRLAMSTRNVNRLEKKGVLPGVRIGGRVLFSDEAIAILMERREREGRKKVKA